MTHPAAIAFLLLAVPALAIAGGKHAGAAPARPPMTVGAPSPIHPPGHRPGHAFSRHPAPPVFFSPIVPGFVTFAPPAVVVVPGPVPLHRAAPATVIGPPVVSAAPAPPAIMPWSPLFFAPPVRVIVPPPAGDQVLIIRRHKH
jgi:hypothetical protein